jgi:Rieske Fe-S protein
MNVSKEQHTNSDKDGRVQKQTRRRFLGSVIHKLAGIGVVAAAGRRLGFPLQGQQKKVLTAVKISENPSLNNVGGFVLIKKTSEGEVLVVRSGDAQYAALSNVCPHKGCHVEVKSKTLIRCPCHHSAYQIDGTYISGPSKASLRKFMFSLEGDVLTVIDADAGP